MATLRSISHQGNYKHVPPRLAYLIRFLMALKNWEKEVRKEQKNKGTSKRGLVESVQIMQLGPVVEKKLFFANSFQRTWARLRVARWAHNCVWVCECVRAWVRVKGEDQRRRYRVRERGCVSSYCSCQNNMNLLWIIAFGNNRHRLH